jgi:protein involved in polysaccharide export with SLBB domain
MSKGSGNMLSARSNKALRFTASRLILPRFSVLRALALAILLQASPALAQDMSGAPCLPIPGGPPCPQQGFQTQPDPSTTGATTIQMPTPVPGTGVPTIRGQAPGPQPMRQPGSQVVPGQQQQQPQQPPVVLPQIPPAPLQPGVAPPEAIAAPPTVPQKPSVATQPGVTPPLQQPFVLVQPDAAQRTEFQEFVAQSVGRYLPLFGFNLFEGVPTTFAPVDSIPVTPDYVVGPGDEILIRAWGQVDIDFRAVVDRNGMINIPRVGNVNVAGIRYQDLNGYLRNAIGRIYRNFQLNVTLGQLRSIQIFVVGQARRPGSYTVSSLTTLVNAVFASGGPSPKGSMRRIQLKRGDKTVTEFDLYDLLLKGDKSKDVQLLPGDVIYIPPVGELAAIHGSVNEPAIYELKGRATLNELLQLSGGLSTTAEGRRVSVERIEDRKARRMDEFALDSAGLGREMKDGDLVRVFALSPKIENAVTLRGSVATPGRYAWREGLRVRDIIPDRDALIVPDYWQRQNRASEVLVAGQQRLRVDVRRSYDEINWDYAVIERLDRSDLSTLLITFNLGRAVIDSDQSNNVPLRPGDVVTIFSKADFQVPISRQTKYVRLEGEFVAPGFYQILPGETLRQLVARVGGFTANAYLFGSEFTRESTREFQQKRLDEAIDFLQKDIQRNLASAAGGAISKEDVEGARVRAEGQQQLVLRLRNLKAAGRIVLELPVQKPEMKDLPELALEDGDRYLVPSRPSVVSVIGAVYNQNAFIYRPEQSVSDYLSRAGGPTRDADTGSIYVIRADGAVVSRRQSGGWFSSGGFDSAVLNPGDAIIVPEELEKWRFTKELKDWTQILYQFALGVAGLKVLRDL